MLAYQFKVALDGAKRIYRNIEILANQTLADFHEAIFSAFDRYDEHLYSFYLTRKATPSRRSRYNYPEYSIIFETDDYGLFFNEKEKYDAAKTKIESLKLKEKDKVYYLFDYGDCWWHEITLLSIVETDLSMGYPKVVKKVGESPEQYPDYEDEDY